MDELAKPFIGLHPSKLRQGGRTRNIHRKKENKHNSRKTGDHQSFNANTGQTSTTAPASKRTSSKATAKDELSVIGAERVPFAPSPARDKITGGLSVFTPERRRKDRREFGGKENIDVGMVSSGSEGRKEGRTVFGSGRGVD